MICLRLPKQIFTCSSMGVESNTQSGGERRHVIAYNINITRLIDRKNWALLLATSGRRIEIVAFHTNTTSTDMYMVPGFHVQQHRDTIDHSYGRGWSWGWYHISIYITKLYLLIYLPTNSYFFVSFTLVWTRSCFMGHKSVGTSRAG